MRNRWPQRLLTGLALFLAFPLAADQVILVNGEVLEGEVLEQTDTFVTLQTLTNTLRLPALRVKEVRPSPPGTMELINAREALMRQQISEARIFLKRAMDKGADDAAATEVRELIDEAQRKMELARYASLIEQARRAAATGEESEVLQRVEEVLTSLPEDSPSRAELTDILVDYHLTRAEDHKDKVRIAMAVEELKQAIQLDPRRAQAYLDLGDIFKGSVASHDQAISCFARAIEYGEKDLDALELTRAYWELGEIYRQQKKWREASLSYREVHNRQPDYNHQLRERLISSFQTFATEIEEDYPEVALNVVEEGLKVRDDIDLLLCKGRILHNMARYQDSSETFRKVLEIEPETKMANYYLAQTYLERGEILKGREALQVEIQVHPENFDALMQLGDLALQRDDYDAAQEYYGRAQELQPDNPKASLRLGRAYRFKEELPKAREAVSEVLARYPDNREANLEMGRILVDEKKMDEAKQYFTNVIELVDQAPPEEREELQSLKADALIARGEVGLLTAGPGTANKDFRKAIEVLPDYGQAYYSIGIAYRKKYASSKQVQDLKTAEENLMKSRQLQPENPQYALQLGILYSQDLAQADTENRKDYLDKAVENWRSYIELGGANKAQVTRWIDEVTGGGTLSGVEQAKANS